MTSQIMINGILCILSFVMFFVALCLDYMDRANGSLIRRCLYVVCLMINVSFIMRIGTELVTGSMLLWWFVGSLVLLLSKVVQYKGKTKEFDKKLRSIWRRFLPRNGGHAAHR